MCYNEVCYEGTAVNIKRSTAVYVISLSTIISVR